MEAQQPVRSPVVTFLSDYGVEDTFVGLCHAAVLAACPEASIVDLSHTVRPQDVVHGAARLADAVAWIDVPAVYLAVVDPGVGTERRGVVVACERSFLVGPDNGLLVPAGERLGGIDRAWVLETPATAAATFHGRDVFAPAAGRLAAGMAASSLGRPLDPQALVAPATDPPSVHEGVVDTRVRDVDRFGNLQLAVQARDLAAAGLDRAQVLTVRTGAWTERVRVARTFAELEPGSLGLLEDSFGRAAVVVNGGSAAVALGLGVHDPVTVEVYLP